MGRRKDQECHIRCPTKAVGHLAGTRRLASAVADEAMPLVLRLAVWATKALMGSKIEDPKDECTSSESVLASSSLAGTFAAAIAASVCHLG